MDDLQGIERDSRDLNLLFKKQIIFMSNIRDRSLTIHLLTNEKDENMIPASD